MNFFPLRSKQLWITPAFVLYGLLIYVLIWGSVPRGRAGFAITACFMLLVIFYFCVIAYETKPGEKIRPVLSLRKQSLTQVLGGPLAAFMIAVSSLSWTAKEGFPEYATKWWWPLAGLAAGWAFGYLFRLVDHQRYRKLHAESVLKSPSKLYVDYVQMPLLFAMLMTWCLPPIVVWGANAVELMVMLGLLLAMMIADGFRMLDPYDQHVPWDERRFQPA